MIEAKTMDDLIESGSAIVIKENQRLSDYIKSYPRLVQMNELELKQCGRCGNYKAEKDFHVGWTCKTCRNKNVNTKYRSDLKANLKQRWYSMKARTPEKECCSFEEFFDFAKNARCKFTGRTLMDDLNEHTKHPNKMMRLEIDHIVPVANGGNTTKDNLQIVPRWYNQAKQNATYEEWKEIENNFFSIGGSAQ